LKERAQNRRLDAAPVQPGDTVQDAKAVAVEFDGAPVIEQAAVEVADQVFAKEAPMRHRLKQNTQLAVKAVRMVAAPVHQPRKEALGQQFDVFGKEAKEQPDQKVSNRFGFCAAALQVLGKLGEFGSGGLRDLFRSLGGAEGVRLIEDG